MNTNADTKTRKKKPSRFFGLIFAVIGLVFISVGGALTYSTYDFMKNAQQTTGQVVSVESNFSDNSVTFQPTFAYFDKDGIRHEGTTFLYSSSYDFALGSKIDILYDPRAFDTIRLNGWFGTWGFGIFILVSGIIPLLIGLFLRKLSKSGSSNRRQKTTTPHDVAPDGDDTRKSKRKSTIQRM